MMVDKFSANAVLSKARAMYGKRLTTQAFHDLLACHSVSEIAYYLKHHTSYGKVLAEINEAELHRGRLEQLLKQKLFDEIASLCLYEKSAGEQFSTYLIHLTEIEQILHAVTFLTSGTPDEYLFFMPSHLRHLVHMDIQALGRITTYQSLLDVLIHTPYYHLLKPFQPASGNFVDYTAIENALYTYLYGTAYEMIRQMPASSAKELTALFDTFLDTENYLRIQRLKHNYNASPDFIRSCLFPFGSVTGKKLAEALDAQTQDAMGQPFKIIANARGISVPELIAHGTLQKHLLYHVCLRHLRFSIHPSVALIAYFFLSEIEIRDLVTVIEGIRYGLPPNEMIPFLTILNYEKQRGGGGS